MRAFVRSQKFATFRGVGKTLHRHSGRGRAVLWCVDSRITASSRLAQAECSCGSNVGGESALRSVPLRRPVVASLKQRTSDTGAC
jgi:hypothetical protein